MISFHYRFRVPITMAEDVSISAKSSQGGLRSRFGWEISAKIMLLKKRKVAVFQYGFKWASASLHLPRRSGKAQECTGPRQSRTGCMPGKRLLSIVYWGLHSTTGGCVLEAFTKIRQFQEKYTRRASNIGMWL